MVINCDINNSFYHEFVHDSIYAIAIDQYSGLIMSSTNDIIISVAMKNQIICSAADDGSMIASCGDYHKEKPLNKFIQWLKRLFSK